MLFCMTVETVFILLAAGVLGGLANSMAGGASLVTFPAMMAAGLAPIPANASNALGIIFGNVMGAYAERGKLPPADIAMIAALILAGVGGALGALLLLNTPERIFVLVVPALIGGATAIFAFSKTIQTWIAKRFGVNSSGVMAALSFPAAIYGGYFGAGVGVIFMAVLSATRTWDLRTANAFKNLLGVLANAVAIVIFIVKGMISWPETLIMMAACMVGGFLGGKALSVISPTTMRKAIVVIGCAMTVYYAWLYWA
jgi:uncharacterized protein